MLSVERELVNALKNGDTHSFELLFKSHYSRLCNYSFGIVKQHEVAEDIVKDFFVKLWENRAELDIRTSLFSYMMRSVYNRSINHLQRHKPKEVYIDDHVGAKLMLEIVEEIEHPLSKLYVSEVQDVLSETLEKLPGRCREIFVMSRNEGLSHKEIAHRLDISENTVKVQVYNALLVIKKALAPFLSFLLLIF